MSVEVVIRTLTTAEALDPIAAFLARDWVEVGGWSLFLGLTLALIIGSFREWWVPGSRYRRLEDSAQKQSETLDTVSKALAQQVTANDIVKHFFEETTPKRWEVDYDGDVETTTQQTRRSQRSRSSNGPS